MPEIVVYAVQGRTHEQKKMLMQKITEAVVESFNVPTDKVVVQIVESDPNNKSRGGVLYSER
ncbi:MULTISPECIES: tautomerase family protein [Pseudomonas]|jgi:4-oxalocrotonate tautomerase|uniref:tautomerase family protein n=1 Tax=Pseudomonas TaxID=286 RepID=UPI001E5F506D|nr:MULTISPECIES: tautomerase family protein [Pseudomonas]MCD4865232.1 tautomerase family protein [Pseudomonas sp. PLB05]UUW73298.1 tautomerase family protein [Pseudomonas psychrotolerans]